jgi:hypothetical protein
MVSTINRETWNGGCLIFVLPDKSENALYKVSAYLLSAVRSLFSAELVDLTAILIFFFLAPLPAIVKANSAPQLQ